MIWYLSKTQLKRVMGFRAHQKYMSMQAIIFKFQLKKTYALAALSYLWNLNSYFISAAHPHWLARPDQNCRRRACSGHEHAPAMSMLQPWACSSHEHAPAMSMLQPWACPNGSFLTLLEGKTKSFKDRFNLQQNIFHGHDWKILLHNILFWNRF